MRSDGSAAQPRSPYGCSRPAASADAWPGRDPDHIRRFTNSSISRSRPSPNPAELPNRYFISDKTFCTH